MKITARIESAGHQGVGASWDEEFIVPDDANPELYPQIVESMVAEKNKRRLPNELLKRFKYVVQEKVKVPLEERQRIQKEKRKARKLARKLAKQEAKK